MFIDKQPKEQIDYYEKMLKTLGSLSRLFSESDEPFLYYRATENLFCKSFTAENLSRGDTSADASKGKVGIGIKTFSFKRGHSLEKVAEFNADHSLYNNLKPEKKIQKISELRNIRIDTTKRIYGLDKIIYHCITRKSAGIVIYEQPMRSIDIDNISKIKVKGKTITFTDGIEEYSFNETKSTLFKKFHVKNILLDLPVKIIDDPFEAISSLFKKEIIQIQFSPIKEQEHIFLPLYGNKNTTKTVFEKSGLNQWNASGRKRDPNEIYIPIPSWIHKKFPNFFPDKDVSFELILPNGSKLDTKVCQDGSKALMSNPNSALGKWLLRDVLNLKEKELLTYEKLEEIGLNTVVIYKVDDQTFHIDFTKIGSYERFEESYL